MLILESACVIHDIEMNGTETNGIETNGTETNGTETDLLIPRSHGKGLWR
ncbi:MAG: hypothetical protein AAFO84_09565 [Cyanobacteria bacterium J06598_1]